MLPIIVAVGVFIIIIILLCLLVCFVVLYVDSVTSFFVGQVVPTNGAQAARSVAVHERRVGEIVLADIGVLVEVDAEYRIAAHTVAAHGEHVRVVGRDDDERVALGRRLQRLADRLVQQREVIERLLRV